MSAKSTESRSPSTRSHSALGAAWRWLSTPLLLAALVGGVLYVSKATVDPRMRQRNADLQAELARVEARNARLRIEVTALEAEIHRLRTDPAESLHHARTQLGMVRTGEVVYQLAATQDADTQ